MKKILVKKIKMVVKQKKELQSRSIRFQFSNHNESKEKCGDSSTLEKIL